MVDNLRNEAGGAGALAFFPVWRRMTLQLVVLSVVCALIVATSEFLGLQVERRFARAAGVMLVLLPPLLWLALSVLPEYNYARPRRRLIGVAVVSGLAASAVGLPLAEDFFRVDQWLPLQSVAQRILGYSLTVGLVDTGLKFLVIRYLVYPQALRVRGDGVAYAFAAAIGYSFYLSLTLVWRLQPSVDFAALLVLGNIAVQLASALFIALGVIESYFSEAFPLVLPLNLLLATICSGLLIALPPGVTSGPLGIAGNSDRPVFGLSVLLAGIIAALSVVYFLYSNAERREREAYLGSEVRDGV